MVKQCTYCELSMLQQLQQVPYATERDDMDMSLYVFFVMNLKIHTWLLYRKGLTSSESYTSKYLIKLEVKVIHAEYLC